MEVRHIPCMTSPPPYAPSPKAQSNVEIHEVEEWIANQFPRTSVADIVECVPASSILNSFVALQTCSSAQQSLVFTQDQILGECRFKFLQVLSYHFDHGAVGGNASFLPSKFLEQAFVEAKQQSVQRCENVCDDNQYDEPTTARLKDRIQNFIRDAQAKIETKNHINCLRYLERDKKNEIEKFCDNLKERYMLLYQALGVKRSWSI